MDSQEQKKDNNQPEYNGRVWGGLFLLLVGGVFLMKQMGLFYFPGWLFTWPMIIIAVGVFSALKHGFRGAGWIVLLLVGGFFLMDQADPDFNLHRYIVPFIIIVVGFSMLFRPHWRRHDSFHERRKWERWQRRRYGRDWNYGNTGQQYYQHYYETRNQQTGAGNPINPGDQPNPGDQQNFSSGPVPPPNAGAEGSTEDYIDSVSVFGGVRRVIMSKNFRGGEATSFMGGTELDFTQADINGTVVLELTQVMGGAKLIVPGHWTIKNEVNAVLGGVDDKRQLNVVTDPNKVLVLKGTSFLGGLEISNF